MTATANLSAEVEVITKTHGPIDVIKHRPVYLAIAAALLLPGLVFIVLSMINSPNFAPVKLGIDFTGGTILEYAFEKKLTQNDVTAINGVFEKYGYPGSVIQIEAPRQDLNAEALASALSNSATQKDVTNADDHPAVQQTTTVESQPVTKEQIHAQAGGVVSIRSKQIEKDDHQKIEADLRSQFGNLTLLQKNSIGPTLASELLINGLLALVFAYVLITGYLTFRFQLDFAVCAIVALLHDTLFVISVFSALGYLYNVEVDSLFVTAILTVVGFSVHDTIVVFDRLRENTKLLYSKKLPFAEIANISVNQTLARSINTSLTALLPLVALYFFGGETTKNFVLAIILGIMAGTYSSICVATAILAWWRDQKPSAQVAAIPV